MWLLSMRPLRRGIIRERLARSAAIWPIQLANVIRGLLAEFGMEIDTPQGLKDTAARYRKEGRL